MQAHTVTWSEVTDGSAVQVWDHFKSLGLHSLHFGGGDYVSLINQRNIKMICEGDSQSTAKKTNLKISQWVNPQGCRLESLKRNGGGVNGQSLTSGRGPIGGDMLLCWGWNWFSYLHTVSVSTSSSSSSLFCFDSCFLHKLWRGTIFGAVKRGGLCVCV